MVEAWQKWLIVIGGLVAVIGQFWGSDIFLPLIGGAVAAIVGFLLK